MTPSLEMNHLANLASLIQQKNAIENEIASLIGRPALIGHVGEYIASHIFDIELMESASYKSIDGYFRSGSLSGKSVNIKWYGKQEGILDITPAALPDFYLVMTGPKSTALTSRKGTRPWAIAYVYLFDAKALVSELNPRGGKIGIATAVPRAFWDGAEIYPDNHSSLLTLLPEQNELLGLFDNP